MKNRPLTTLALMALLLVLAATGARGQRYFRSFNKTQGLIDNTVYTICQDRRGFLWMGTPDGLCRFDGVNFEKIDARTDSLTSLSAKIVRHLLADDDGIWMATDDGIARYDFSDERIHRCPHDDSGVSAPTGYRFNRLIQGRRHLFAVDNYGHVYRYDGHTQFRLINQHGAQYDALTNGPDSLLIATGPEGLYLLKADGDDVVAKVSMSAPHTSLVNVHYNAARQTAYVGYGIGYASRAFRIEGLTIRPVDEEVPPALMGTANYAGGVVFATDGGGLTFVNGGHRPVSLTPRNSNISGDAVYSLFVDRDDNLWIGIYRSGLNLYSERQRMFSVMNRNNRQLSYDIVTAVVSRPEALYVGLDGGGLEIHPTDGGPVRVLTAANSPLPGDNIVSMVDDGERLWLAVYTKGLVCYSPRDGRMTTVSMPLGDDDANNVWTLCDDHRGNIWVGGPNVFVVKKDDLHVTRLDSLGRADCLALTLNGGCMWVGCRYQGIFQVDLASQRVVAHHTADHGDQNLPADDIALLHTDSEGDLWFCLVQGGLYCREHVSGLLRRIDREDGLDEEHVTSMREDADGNLLVGTINGLYRYARATRTFVHIDIDDVAPEFTYNCNAEGPDGRLYFGTTQGLVSFMPGQICVSHLSNDIYFTSIELMGSEPELRSLFTCSEGEVRLTHHQNFFTVHYAVAELSAPDHVQFSCQLEGLERTWRQMGQTRQVSYTSVPPGSYRLLVRCTDADGQWGQPAVLSITVAPAWYATWWARLLWGMLICAAVVGAVWFYRRELSIKHQMELAEKEKATERKLNEQKMNFYTLMTHELRTPVFLIMTQLEQLLGEGKLVVQAPRTYISDIHRHAIRLNNLVSRVIDFRRVGAAQLQLELRRADVAAYCTQMTESYVDMFRLKDIDYTLQTSVPELWLDFDPLKLDLILSNLLSNAFKYTQPQGQVRLSVSDAPDRVNFAVSDTGIGIDPRVRGHIFDQYFRSERGKRLSQGDGLGLAYVKQLVELQGGRISVESEMGRGSVFTFYIPKQLSATTPPLPEKDAAMLAPTPPTNPAALHSLLIADDDPAVVNLLERNLNTDFLILKAADGEEALNIITERQPDIVLLDLQMPRMDGQELLVRLNTDKALKRTKTIVLTARTAEEDIMKALDAGADAYLTKPVSLRLLRLHIDRLLNTPAEAESPTPVDEKRKPYNKEEQQLLTRLRQVIDQHMADQDFSINLLAASMNMSHSALYKRLKTMTGMSLVEFINDYKIFKAVQLFQQGETSVEQVCELCGFGDPKNFRSMFKRKMHMTPKQYIQSL